jgi:hypothetical protein
LRLFKKCCGLSFLQIINTHAAWEHLRHSLSSFYFLDIDSLSELSVFSSFFLLAFLKTITLRTFFP